MKLLLTGIGLTALAALAQVNVPNTYGSAPGGFGNVVYPGTGRPPQVRYPSVNGPGANRGGGGAARPGIPAMAHPSHVRTVAVPYPVYMGGYSAFGDYNGFDTPAAVTYQDQGSYAPQQATPTVVIINQGYRPDTANPVFRDYSDAQLPETPRSLRTYEGPVQPDPAAQAESERPTIYLIAFKDHTVLAALAYWVEGDMLRYVTKDGKPNGISLSLVDRDLSRQMNKQLNLEFNIP